MPRIQYKRFNFRPESLRQIEQANEIIAQYAAQGFQLTLRQLYYQFVSRALIPNNDKEYKKLGETISNGRLAGFIDWNSIVDRTRNLRSVSHWDEPSAIIESAARSYRIDKWNTQSFRPEVWIEKDALVGVIEGICRQLDVPYFSCRGYTSQSELWSAAERLIEWTDPNDQRAIIFHLGDHDPSGKDMTRDITDRLDMFGANVEIERLALNWDQIEQYQPPPNPAKITDTRATAYIAEFGPESWELDALDPAVIVGLIQDAIENIRDPDKWEEAIKQENQERDWLFRASRKWGEVTSFLNNKADSND